MSIDVSCKLHKRQGGEKMTITMSGKTIGENIKLARMQAGISRAKLAEELCVSVLSLSRAVLWLSACIV